MNRLREMRESKNLSIQKLIDDIKKETGKKIVKASFCNYERGKQDPKNETWKVLADYFGVSIAYLMGLTDSRNDFGNKSTKEEIERCLLSATDEIERVLIGNKPKEVNDEYLNNAIEIIKEAISLSKS